MQQNAKAASSTASENQKVLTELRAQHAAELARERESSSAHLAKVWLGIFLLLQVVVVDSYKLFKFFGLSLVECSTDDGIALSKSQYIFGNGSCVV